MRIFDFHFRNTFGGVDIPYRGAAVIIKVKLIKYQDSKPGLLNGFKLKRWSHFLKFLIEIKVIIF